MRRLTMTLTAIALAVPTVALAAPPAGAEQPARARHAVFVQTNGPSGNAVIAFHRLADGTLRQDATYPTGGLGGFETGAPADALASQGSLVYHRRQGVLLAANAGSDSVTVFGADGDVLTQRQVVPSGGSFPVSIAVHGDLVYVLNAGGEGVVQGFRLAGGLLQPLAGSARSLGLANATPPSFMTAPGQVAFARHGSALLVTTKGNGTIDGFAVGADGLLSAAPVHNPSAGPVPFSLTHDPAGNVLVTEADMTNASVSSYRVKRNGSLALLTPTVHNGQAATCWITFAQGHAFVSNTGSGTLSAYTSQPSGALALVGVVATTNPGPIDSAASRDGRYLYVQEALAGTVQVFTVGADGSLALLTTVTGLPAFVPGVSGMEGIAAS